MTLSVLKAKQDAYASQSQPTKNFGSSGELVVRTDTGADRYAYVFFPGLPPDSAVIASATLRLVCKTAMAGSNTFTARRITDSWKQERLDWDNKPATSGTNVGTEVASGLLQFDLVEIDVTAMMQQVVNGAQWFGIRVGNSAAGNRSFYSSDAREPTHRPELKLDWSLIPDAPVDLTPAGSRAVSLAKPTLGWTFRDRDGDTQSEAQVQIDAAKGGFATPDFDSGWTAATEPELDLTATAYAGLSDAQVVYWRVRVRDSLGNTSDWSEVETFERRTKGTLAISVPGATVETTTPDITTTLTGRSQASIEYVLEFDDDGVWREVWRRGPFVASAASGSPYTQSLPPGLLRLSGASYKLSVRSWDTIRRAATPGDPTHVADVQLFEFVLSDVDAPISLTAEASKDSPVVYLTWLSDATPDYFALIVDGVMVDDRIDPTDVAAGTVGSDFQFQSEYLGAPPYRLTTIEVQAVVDVAGELVHSADAPTASVEVRPSGIWLLVEGTDQRVQLLGQQPAAMTFGRSGTRFNPVGSQRTVRITDTLRGLEGTIAGTLWTEDEGDDFLQIVQAGEDGAVVRLVLGLLNIPILIDGEQMSPTPLASPDEGGAWEVSFDAAQDGEFTIKASP